MSSRAWGCPAAVPFRSMRGVYRVRSLEDLATYRAFRRVSKAGIDQQRFQKLRCLLEGRRPAFPGAFHSISDHTRERRGVEFLLIQKKTQPIVNLGSDLELWCNQCEAAVCASQSTASIDSVAAG